MSKKIFGYTDFKTAIRWCNNDWVSINVPNVDEEVCLEYEEWYHRKMVEEEGYTEEEANVMSDDVYSWVVTDGSEWDMDYLKETFGITTFYSNKLGAYVFPITFYGASWEEVKVPVYSEKWYEVNKDKCFLEY